MQPSEIMQRPLITEQAPDLAPLWPYQRFGGLLQLRLRPLPIVPLPVWPQYRQRQCDPPADACRLHSLIKVLLGLGPRPPRLLGHAAGITAPLLALRDFAVGLCDGVSLPLSPLPLAMHAALE